MHSRLRITGAYPWRHPAITAAWVAVLVTAGCSRPAGEVAPPVDAQATQQPVPVPPEQGADDPPAHVKSATDVPDAATTPLPSEASEAAAAPGSRREQVLQRFTNRHGRDQVVVIRVSRADGLRPGVLVQKLTDQLGGVHYFATRPSADAILAVPYAGEIEDVAELIDWGKVTSIDPQQRLIRVDATQN